MTSTPAPRTLADQLRGWSDEQLTALLRERPDLANPAPQDCSQVASRAAVRASLLQAMERLNRPELALLELLADGGPRGTDALVRASPMRESVTTAALARLVDLALVWGGPEQWRAMSQVSDGLGPDPGGPLDEPPEVATSPRDASLVDRAGAGAAFETCRRVALLADVWGTRPPGVLRTGGLGVRDLRATAALLQVPEPEAALLVETAVVAGLVSTTWHQGRQVWAPTRAADLWESKPLAQQWVDLATAWLSSNRLVGLVGTRDRAGKTWNALAPELSGQFTVEARRMALQGLARLPEGTVLAAGTGLPSLISLIEWLRPRRPRTRADQVGWALQEAERLGVAALGGLTSAGRALLHDQDAAEVLEPMLPTPVDHVLVQADLTAVAPGPLEPEVARRLHEVADVESRGGATVHRFTKDSLRRALDGGWSAAEIHDFVASVSSTPVPQALSYLVDDVARTHGTLRVGHAEAFLRTDDEAALAALLADPRAASLGLRRLAPTVVISTTPIEELIARLRELGAAPVVESIDGTVHVARPDMVRATGRPRPPAAGAEVRRTAQLAQVVRAIRLGDRSAASRPAPSTHLSPAESLARLREAAQAGTPVWIGYVDNHGTSSERIVDPVSVEGGTLTAHDHRTEGTQRFTVHRITSVRPVTPP